MGIWAWLILLAVSAALATAGQYAFFRTIHPKATDHDWVFMAGGALLGGFTANVWYGSAWNIGPMVDGLYLAPALLGAAGDALTLVINIGLHLVGSAAVIAALLVRSTEQWIAGRL